jgi:SAM-dependent methyltransferase
VHKTDTLDLVPSAALGSRIAGAAAPLSPEHPRSLLALPHGEARESLLAVHGVLEQGLPPTPLAIYEAGGGSTSFLPLDVLRRAEVTVVDIDPEQLRNSDYAQTTVLGDIQTHRFAPDSFDLVICYNVIEHLADVEAALEGFRMSLKRGGLIVIGAPNPSSLSGVVTKYSPHWFHVWFYRHVRGERNAGQPGHPPFPTLFHPLVTPARLEDFADAYGLDVIYHRDYESPRYPEIRITKPWFGALLDAAAAVLNRLIGGNTDVRHGDYHMILRRP